VIQQPDALRYLRETDACLASAAVPPHYRRFLLRDLERHLEDAVAEARHTGLAPTEAWQLAVANMGPPEELANEAHVLTRRLVHRFPKTFVFSLACATFLSSTLVCILFCLGLLIGQSELGVTLLQASMFIQISAVVGSVTTVLLLCHVARRTSGIDRHTLAASIGIAVICSLLSVTTDDATTLQFFFVPTVNFWQMTPALITAAAIWYFRLERNELSGSISY
jgi:hypothetical protein